MADLSKELGIIGQLPGLSTYCVILLGFALRDDSKRDEIIANLKSASTKLNESFPWLAGQVVKILPRGEEASSSSGTFKISPYNGNQGKQWIQVNDCTRLLPSFDEYVAAKAPMSMLRGDILSPHAGIPVGHDYTQPAPVISLQVNLVKGGMLLTFAGMHHAVDMTGLGVLIRQFAKVCRGEELTEDDISGGMIDQTTAIPNLPEGEEPDPLTHIRRESRLGGPGWEGMPIAAPWVCYRFNADVSARLKEEAKQDLSPEGAGVSFVSTNDVISAFFWQRLSIARSRRIDPSKNKTTALGRAVQGRRALNPPLPDNYVGHIVTVAPTTWSIAEIVDAPIGAIAAQLRRDIQLVDDRQIRSFAHLLSRETDKTKFGYEATTNPDIDLMVSSWADLGLYASNFGAELGQPEFVRRPKLAEIASLAYIMPRTRDGHWDICVSLMEDDVKALDEDTIFTTLVEKIG